MEIFVICLTVIICVALICFTIDKIMENSDNNFWENLDVIKTIVEEDEDEEKESEEN